MKAEDLKNSILQLAMEGKLVPQDSNDEPASVLLEKIRDEKEKLIKEKKIKRNNKESFIFRKNGHFYEKIGKKGEPICIDNEIPFEVPDSWEWCRLNTICTKITDGSHNPPPKKDFGIPVLSVKNINQNEIDFDSIYRFTDEEGFNKENPRTNICRGDIILGIVGSIGAVAIYKSDEKVIAQRSIAIIKTEIFNYFLTCAFESNLFKEYAKTYSKGTAQRGLYLKALKEFLVPIPPLNEQKRIVNIINNLDPLINEYNINKKKLDKLNFEFPDKLKSSILQEAIQGKLVPQNPNDEPAYVLLERIRDEKERMIKEKKIKRNKNESYIFKENNHFYEKTGKKDPICIDDEILFDIPDNWEWCKLENIIELISGRDLKKTQYNDLKKGIPYVTGASNIINNQLLINRWTEEPAVIAIKNDILLSCKGTIGKILILNEDKVHIARQIMSIRLIDETLINRNYIVIFLMYYVTNLINIAKSMIPGISREDVLKINIPLPPLEEQKRIVEKIYLLFEELNF